MNRIEKITLGLARASKGCPMIATMTVMLFYLMFNVLEGFVERLIFGDRLEHWLDPVFISAFIFYAGYACYWCAIFNTLKDKESQQQGEV